MRLRGFLLLLALLLVVGRLPAQTVEGRIGRFYEGAGWTLYQVGLSRPLWGPLGLAYHGSYLVTEDGGDGGFAGVGADLTAFRGNQGPYLVAGLGGGLGSPHSWSFSSFWGSWSAGAGYELFPLSFLAFTAEARWREISLDAREGLQLSAGLSIRFGGGGSRPAAPGTPRAPPATLGTVLRDSVVGAAIEAMGRPYLLGGDGADGGGFDCSGLIQYAYGKYGVPLPRTSREQALEGKRLGTRVPDLAPGDLLTFSDRGGPVTHVGMYVGEGRFIHSATRGVQVSMLSNDDPYGRWWYSRWVGARRIVDEGGDRLGE